MQSTSATAQAALGHCLHGCSNSNSSNNSSSSSSACIHQWMCGQTAASVGMDHKPTSILPFQPSHDSQHSLFRLHNQPTPPDQNRHARLPSARSP